MKKESFDFASNSIPKIFGKLFIPTLLGLLSTATLTIVEGVFVGRGVGSDGLAAINIACPLFMITAGIGLMFGIGASIVASIHLSRNKQKAAQINTTQAMVVSSLIMLLISAGTMMFQDEVGYLFGSSDHLLPLVTDYMQWLAPSLVFCMIGILGLFIVRLDGSPVYAMLCSVIPATVNILLCWLFVIRLDWGIMGAALATSIGVSLGGLMVLTYLFFFSRRLRLLVLHTSQKGLKQLLRNSTYMIKLGSSAFLGEMAILVMVVMGNYVFMKHLGDDGVAAFSVACYCFPLIYMFGSAIAQSAQPIISFNYGSQNWTRVKKTMYLSVGTALLSGMTATLATIFLSQPLVNLFLDPACKANQIATSGMPYFALGFVFFTVNMACVGYFQSIERAKMANTYTVLRGFVFLFVTFLTLPALLGEKGIWLAVPCSEMVTTVVVLLWFLRKKKLNS